MNDVRVITVSDRVAAGAAEDGSGPALVQLLLKSGFRPGPIEVVSDNPGEVRAAIEAAVGQVGLVLTTGGTGLSPRDRTADVTSALADYLVPGMAEEMRRVGREKTPRAVLSRAVVAVVGRSLVVNLPGSRAGAVESLEALLPVIPHALEQLAGGGH